MASFGQARNNALPVISRENTNNVDRSNYIQLNKKYAGKKLCVMLKHCPVILVRPEIVTTLR